jgi:hypothetical protein
MNRDRRWLSSLTSVVSKDYITFGDNGRGRVLLVGIVKVSENVTPRHVAHIKSLRSNLLSVSQMRVLRSVSRWALLVCWIIEVILYA